MVSAYDQLPRTPANFVALSPLRYLERAAYIYPNQDAIVHGARHISWRDTYTRRRQFAHQLQNLGIQKNDTVSVLLPNIPAMVEAHFAVPMAGAVLNTLNTRLDAKTIAFMLEHAETKVLLVDPEFAALAKEAVALIAQQIYIIDVADEEYENNAVTARIGQIEYEDWLKGGDADFEWHLPQDEWDAISLNYTSGTTGNPKGVVYHHRGAYINAASNIIACGMTPRCKYLWTLPLFHCNGWCFAWTVAANGGTNICLRKIDPELVYQLIDQYKVDYFCGAPIVLSMLINTPKEQQIKFEHHVEVMVAGAAPLRQLLKECIILVFKSIMSTVSLKLMAPLHYVHLKQVGVTCLFKSKHNYTRVKVYLIHYKMVCVCWMLKRCNLCLMTARPWEKLCSVATLL